MAQTGNFSPIQLYSSSTPGNAPAVGNLVNSTLGSELAINIADGKLFYKDSANAIQVIAWKVTPTTAGGTGLTSYSAGDMTYWASGTAFSKLTIGTSGYFMTSSGSAPQWTDPTTVAVTSISFGSTGLTPATATKGAVTVAGTLAVGNGGTGKTSWTANGVLYASGTGTLANGSALTFDGANLGVGVTPSNAGGITTNIELPYGATIASRSNTAAPQLYITSNGVGTGYASTYKVNGYATQYVMQGFTGCHYWYVAPSGTAGNAISFTQAMMIDNSSNLLVGTDVLTTTVQGTRVSSGNISLSKASEAVSLFVNGGGAQIAFYRFDNNTYMGGIYNQPSLGVAYTTASDYRLKNITGKLTGSEDFINSLKPKEGSWKSDGSKFVGFLAHEFQAVSPSSAYGEKDAVDSSGNPIYQSIEASSQEVIANIVALLQEHIEINKELTKRIEILEAK